MDIGAIFRAARKNRGMTLNHLGDLVGTDTGNISRFETGKQSLNFDTLAKIMAALEISFTGPFTDSSNIKSYPLLKWKLIDRFLKDNKVDGRELKTTVDAGDNAFWVEVSGDFMFADYAPSFVEGSRILVDRGNTRFENGGLYVIYLAGPNEYVFRQYVGYDGSGFLRPLKTIYAPVAVPPDALVIGRVVDSKQKGL